MIRCFGVATSRALETVVTDTRSYYWIGFTPKWQGDDHAHRVDVAVRDRQRARVGLVEERGRRPRRRRRRARGAGEGGEGRVGVDADRLDPALREELDAFVARRKAEGGAPTDF